MKTSLQLTLLFSVFLLFAIGCESKENAEQLSMKPLSTATKQIETEEWMTSERQQWMEQLKLEGGSEQTHRKPEATANHILQKKYPQQLYLKGESEAKKIALTFDDGPDKRFTPQLLNVLKHHNVKATFFTMGARVKGHPEIAKRIVAEGHEIGNHTYWHPNLVEVSMERLMREVKNTESVIEEMTGVTTRLFRAPYGSLTEEIVEQLSEMDYSVIGWSVDSLDWRQLPPEEISINVLSDVYPGAFILYHDGGDWTMDLSGTIQSVDYVITTLKEKGYQFVTVSELLQFEKN